MPQAGAQCCLGVCPRWGIVGVAGNTSHIGNSTMIPGQLESIMTIGVLPDAMKPGFHCYALDPGFHGAPLVRHARTVVLMVPMGLDMHGEAGTRVRGGRAEADGRR